MSKIAPCLWFNGDAEEAAKFYVSVLPDSRIDHVQRNVIDSPGGKATEPHRVARYSEELAGAYHRWYDNCRVTPLGDEEVTDLHRTRLWLNDSVGQVLRNSLGLLGVSAPERM